MPFVENNPALLRVPSGVPVPDQQQPNVFDTVGSAFRQDNPAVNVARNLLQKDFPPEEGYNPMDELRQPENARYLRDHVENFVRSRSPAETQSIMRKIDEEDADRQVLAKSGTAGFLAQVAAGTIDPTIAMPGAILVRGVKGGYSVGRTALATALAGGAQVAAQEGVLQANQETRTAGESAMAIGSGTLLASLIGGGAAALLSRAERRILENALEIDRARIDQHAGNARPMSAGAAAVNEPPLGNEKVQAAAIRVDGKTFTGPTHADAIIAAEDALKMEPGHLTSPDAPKVDSGFVTTAGRFVDRHEADRIARGPNADTGGLDAWDLPRPENQVGAPLPAQPHPDAALGEALRITDALRPINRNLPNEDRAILGEAISAVRGAAAKRQLSIGEGGAINQGKGPLAAAPVADHGPERIIGATIIANNRVFIGRQHLFAVEEARKAGLGFEDFGHVYHNKGGVAIQGEFITSRGRLISRAEAGELVGKSGRGITAEGNIPRTTSAADQALIDRWQGRTVDEIQATKADRPEIVAHAWLEADQELNRARSALDKIDEVKARHPELAAQIDALTKAVDDIRAQREAMRPPAEPIGPTSGGAASADTRQLEMFSAVPSVEGIPLVGPFLQKVLNKIPVPALRAGLQASLVRTRRAFADLASSPYRFKENSPAYNEAGEMIRGPSPTASAPPIDILSEINVNRNRKAVSDELHKQYADYRFADENKSFPAVQARVADLLGNNPEGKMTYAEFKRQVSEAMKYEDRHEIPQVSNAAVYIRSLQEPWLDRAERAIPNFERIEPAKGESHFPHYWNQKKIRENPTEFVDDQVKILQADQDVKQGIQQKLEFYNAQLQSWEKQISKLEARSERAQARADRLDNRAAERSRDDMPKTPGLNEPDATGRIAELQTRKAMLQAEAKDLADLADLTEELLRQNPMLAKPLQKTLNALEANGRRIDIATAKHAEAGSAGKRSEKRLAELERQLSDTETRQQMIEDYLIVAREMHDQVRTKIEEQLGLWEGKSSKEANDALKTREEYDIQRKAKAAVTEGGDATSRLTMADAAVDRAVKRILASDRNLSTDELRDIANEFKNRILNNNPDGRIPYDLHTGGPRVGISDGSPPRGSLAARQANLTNAQASKWIEDDVEETMNRWFRTVVPDVLLSERFGDPEMSNVFREHHEGYGRLIDAATNQKDKAKLQKEQESIAQDLAGIRDRVRGVFGYSSDQTLRNMARVAAGAKMANNVTNLGVSALSSLPDAAGALIMYGLKSGLGDGYLTLIRALSDPEGRAALKKFKNEMAAANIGIETYFNARQRGLDDITEMYRPQNRFERALSNVNDKYFVANLLGPWTDAVKLIGAHVSVSNILRATKAVADGKATKDQLTRLAESFIDQHMAARIWQQFSDPQFGGSIEKGVMLPNTKDWADQAAAEALQAAVYKDVNTMVVTPGQEKALWMSRPILSMLGQFLSYTASANEKILVRNLQTRDAQALTGIAAATGLGMLAYKLNELTGGQKTSDRPQDWVKEGMSRANVLGWFETANTIASKASRGKVDIYALAGADKPVSRYASQSAADMLLGPTWPKIKTIIRAPGSALSGDWSAADTTAMRRLIAGQNLFYVRGLVDQMENATNSYFNVPARKEPTRH